MAWMSRSDRRAWSSAQSLRSLGELMARWLERDISSWPGYAVGRGPESETVPHVASLARLCRSGVVTVGSQPGCREIAPDGEVIRQRAAIEGFADTATVTRLQQHAENEFGLYVAPQPIRPWWWKLRHGHPYRVDVTTVNGHVFTDFAPTLSRGNIDFMFHACGKDVRDEIKRSTFVTIVDLEWEENTRLWTAIDSFAEKGNARDEHYS